MEWKNEDPEDVEMARKLFTELTQQGWLAVLDSTSDKNRVRILEFKAEHGKLHFVPLSEGG